MSVIVDFTNYVHECLSSRKFSTHEAFYYWSIKSLIANNNYLLRRLDIDEVSYGIWNCLVKLRDMCSGLRKTPVHFGVLSSCSMKSPVNPTQFPSVLISFLVYLSEIACNYVIVFLVRISFIRACHQHEIQNFIVSLNLNTRRFSRNSKMFHFKHGVVDQHPSFNQSVQVTE